MMTVPFLFIVSVTATFIITMVMMIIIMVTEARFGVHQASHIR